MSTVDREYIPDAPVSRPLLSPQQDRVVSVRRATFVNYLGDKPRDTRLAPPVEIGKQLGVNLEKSLYR